MIATLHHSLLAVALIALLELAVIVRILLRPHRDPASRIAWMVVVAMLPLLGMLAYLLLGEVNIGRRRVERLHAVLERMPPIPCHAAGDAADLAAAIPERYRHLFQLGHSISGFHPVGGNTAHLLPNSNATIDAMVADIDAAKDHVHVLFYIWLPDHNGRKVVEALKRAAARGVTCRAMADDLGSRTMIRSEHWQAMRAAGVRVAAGLPIGNPLLRPFVGPHRPSEPSQDRGHRRSHHLLRQPELRRSRVPREGEVRPLGGRRDALRGSHRTPEPVPVRERLDDVRG